MGCFPFDLHFSCSSSCEKKIFWEGWAENSRTLIASEVNPGCCAEPEKGRERCSCNNSCHPSRVEARPGKVNPSSQLSVCTCQALVYPIPPSQTTVSHKAAISVILRGSRLPFLGPNCNLHLLIGVRKWQGIAESGRRENNAKATTPIQGKRRSQW